MGPSRQGQNVAVKRARRDKKDKIAKVAEIPVKQNNRNKSGPSGWAKWNKHVKKIIKKTTIKATIGYRNWHICSHFRVRFQSRFCVCFGVPFYF